MGRIKNEARREARRDRMRRQREAVRFPHYKRPCVECPWRLSNKPGKFSADRYRALAGTSADMAMAVFACHMSHEGADVACAGWLLSLDAQHNLSVRLAKSDGALDPRTIVTDAPLHHSYYRLARANGVPAGDPSLAILRRDCR